MPQQIEQKPAAKPMSPREAVCQYMGWDFAEAGDYRYHYGRTSAPIYSTADGYVCATATGKKPPKYDGLHWKEAAGSNAEYCKIRGKTVWIASGEIEE
jgi:hypothetical protein